MFKQLISAATAVAVAATPLLVGAPAAHASDPPASSWLFGNWSGALVGGSTFYAYTSPGSNTGSFRTVRPDEYDSGVIGGAALLSVVNSVGSPYKKKYIGTSVRDVESLYPTLRVISGACAVDGNVNTVLGKPPLVIPGSGEAVVESSLVAVTARSPQDCVVQLVESGDTVNVKILPQDHTTAPVTNDPARVQLRTTVKTLYTNPTPGVAPGLPVGSITLPLSSKPVGLQGYFDNILLPHPVEEAPRVATRTSVVSGPCKVSGEARGSVGQGKETYRSPLYLFGAGLGDCLIRFRHGSWYTDIPVKVKDGGSVEICSENCATSKPPVVPPTPTCETTGCAGEPDRANPQVPGPPAPYDPQGPIDEQPNSVPTTGPRGAAPVIVQLDEIKKVKAVEAQTFKKYSARISSKDRKALKKWGKQNTKAKDTVLVTVGYAGFNAKRDLQINLVSAKRAKNTANAVLKNPKKSTFLAKGTTPAQLKKLLGKKKAKKVFKKGGNRVAITMAVTLK